MSKVSMLASRAVIARYNAGAWRVQKKKNKAETAAYEAKHNLKAGTASVSNDICDHPALKEIYKLQAAARNDVHYRLTLPAADDGMRILAGAFQVEHAKKMGEIEQQIKVLVTQFLADYPAEAAAAPARLNGTYDASQWPSVEVIASKFYFRLRYLPVPSLPLWDEWMAESAAVAEEDLKARLATAVTTLAHSLANGTRFNESLITNLADICALAGDLNLRDDPVIANLAIEGAKLAASISPQEVRDSKTVKEAAAARAATIAGMFSL